MTVQKNGWKTLSKKNLIENKFVSLWEEQVERPDGKVSTYYVSRRAPFSIILPYHQGNFYLAKQYRYAVDSLSLEFPMGYVEGKNPRETAEVELKEEAGITAKKLTEIGKFWVSVGRSDQVAYVYLAEELVFGEQELEDGEFIEIETYTPEEVSAMIEQGVILDGVSISAYHFAMSYLRKKT